MNKIISKLVLACVFLSISFTSLNAEVRFGVEGGLAYADMRAEETAQILANLSGSTVTYVYDETTWFGRFFGEYVVSEDFGVELGLFTTGSLDATYTISGASATESYEAAGVDVTAVIHNDNLFFKAGMHSSDLTGSGSLTIDGTKYSITETISGTGFLAGGGIEIDNTRYGITYYSSLGGDSDSSMTMLYAGLTF